MSALVYVLLATVAGVAADRLLPGAVPYGAVAAALAGLIVAVLVSLPLGDQGPQVLTVAVMPAAAGAWLGALAMRLLLARLTARSAQVDGD